MTESPRSRSEAHAGKQRTRTLLGILVLALALRLLLIAIKGKSYYFADTAEYDAAARSLLSGQVSAATILRAPVYPAFMAAVYRVAGEGNYPAVRWAQLLFGLGVVGLTALLARRMGRAGTAGLAGLGAALSPTLLFTTTMLYPCVLYTLLLLIAVLLARRIREAPGIGAAAALGGVFTLAWLTEFMFVGTMLAILAWLLSGMRTGGRKLGLAVAVAVLVFGGSFTLWWSARPHSDDPLRSPLAKAQYVLYLARHDPSFVGGHQVRVDSEVSFRPLPVRAFLEREAGLLAAQPGAYLHDYAFEFLHFFNPMPDRIQTSNAFTGGLGRTLVTIYFLPVLLFAMVGLWSAAAGRDRVLLVLVPVSTAAVYALFFTQMRYRIPTEPFLLVLAAFGVERAWEGLRNRAPARAELVPPGAVTSGSGT